MLLIWPINCQYVTLNIKNLTGSSSTKSTKTCYAFTNYLLKYGYMLLKSFRHFPTIKQEQVVKQNFQLIYVEQVITENFTPII